MRSAPSKPAFRATAPTEEFVLPSQGYPEYVSPPGALLGVEELGAASLEVRRTCLAREQTRARCTARHANHVCCRDAAQLIDRRRENGGSQKRRTHFSHLAHFRRHLAEYRSSGDHHCVPVLQQQSQ